MKRIISIILCLCLMTGFTFAVGASKQDDISALQSKSDKLRKEINSLKNKKAEQEKLRDKLAEQITNTQEEISLWVSKINDSKAEIAKFEAQIAKKNKEIDENKYAFKKRMRTIYMNASGSNEMLMLLGSEDFANFLTTNELAKRINAKDNMLMSRISDAIKEIEKSEAGIQEQIAEQRRIKSVLDEKNAELKSERDQINGVIGSLQKQQNDDEAAMKSIDKQIANLLETANHSNVVYSGAAFAWPVPGYYGISSPYGMRWGSMHSGVDISSSGINGAKVVAAADGVILTSGWNGGYGNCVTINHGVKDGTRYTTLYGHLSSVAVSSGQSVSKGQTIGYVGSTGQSTGPHLHFEISVGGARVNPMNFYSKVG